MEWQRYEQRHRHAYRSGDHPRRPAISPAACGKFTRNHDRHLNPRIYYCAIARPRRNSGDDNLCPAPMNASAYGYNAARGLLLHLFLS